MDVLNVPHELVCCELSGRYEIDAGVINTVYILSFLGGCSFLRASNQAFDDVENNQVVVTVYKMPPKVSTTLNHI